VRGTPLVLASFAGIHRPIITDVALGPELGDPGPVPPQCYTVIRYRDPA